jgi:hypothetical protein
MVTSRGNIPAFATSGHQQRHSDLALHLRRHRASSWCSCAMQVFRVHTCPSDQLNLMPSVPSITGGSFGGNSNYPMAQIPARTSLNPLIREHPYHQCRALNLQYQAQHAFTQHLSLDCQGSPSIYSNPCASDSPMGAGRRRRRCNRTVGKRGFVLPAQRLASYAARAMSVARA